MLFNLKYYNLPKLFLNRYLKIIAVIFNKNVNTINTKLIHTESAMFQLDWMIVLP